MVDKLKEHWLKLIIVGVVAFVVAGIFSDVQGIMIAGVLIAVAAVALGALGLVLKILSAAGEGARRLGKTVKNFSKKMSGKIKGNSASSSAINKGIGDGVKFDGTSRLTLYANDGSEVVFKEYGVVVYAGKFYAVLQPVNRPAGMKENEVLVFNVTIDSHGTDHYNIVTSDSTVDAVLNKYNRL
ncbi:MAG: DUF1292 domain-containing protein [Clostridia bacterium]|nr:DUF1292 domain-containing protein [Clostridia bacterium]